MLEDNVPSGTQERTRRRSVAWVAIALWLLLAAVLAYYHWMSPSASPAPSSAVQERGLAVLIAERTADLGLTPKVAVTPADLALATVVALKQGNQVEAAKIADDVLAHSTEQSWRFYPFNEFMGSLFHGDDPELLKRLNAWVAKDPKSAVAYLIRATYFREAGWTARGSGLGKDVPEPLMRVFDDDIARSRADLLQSVALNPHNPWSYYALLQDATSQGDSLIAEQTFQSAIAAFPRYYPLYKKRLHSITPKWGGSIEAMYAFVDQYAGAAPADSPLNLLYLDLYDNLLDAAGFDCGSSNDRENCVKAITERIIRPSLAKGMERALNLYKSSDPIQFSIAVWPLLQSMACGRCYGSPSAVGGVLQMAASIMGSDTQLMDQPGHNNYVLDDITAHVWAAMGNTANADQKFHEALSDLGRTNFPNAADKAVAMAKIYEDLAEFSDDSSQFIDVIVYQSAANTVGGPNHGDAPYRTCYAYYRLKHYAEAIKECSRLIDGNGNYLQSHYWRAKAYEGAGQWDASIADFRPVAEGSDNWFRVGAAIDMSYDYGQKGDYAGQLDSMNRYAFLFDAEQQNSHDLAVSYNNRCFAYMKLGRLQEALDDCTRSLQYDRIPDAFHKQQELLKMLGTKSST